MATYVRARAYTLDQDTLTNRFGLSGTALARRAALSVETVRKQQRVHTYPPGKVPNIELAKAERIAAALDQPVDALFCYPNGDPIGGAL
ncbi:hypothetical protein GCM10009592_26850 [Brachybacterium rhamnosum]|uniref:Transcriptional regulator n=1 Tax=Brachybacterium rhamnosum TaxID=173361 RepID=A0ABW4Q2T5_9MICO